MAGKYTTIRGAVVGDGHSSILGNYVDIKIHHPLATNVWIDTSHAMSGVANRATEAGVDMKCMLGEAGICHDIA